MSITNTIKYPTKLVDGVKTIIDIVTWANQTLSHDELVAFNSSKERNDKIIVEARLTKKIESISYYDSYDDMFPHVWPTPQSPWPQVWGVCLVDTFASNVDQAIRYGLFQEDFTSNLTPLSINQLHGRQVTADFTNNYLYTSYFNHGSYVSADDEQLLYPTRPDLVATEVQVYNTPVTQDEVYASFFQRYKTDPSLTWE